MNGRPKSEVRTEEGWRRLVPICVAAKQSVLGTRPPNRWRAAAALSLAGIIVLGAAFGCISKSKADAQAREAYQAGQRDAQTRMAQQPQVPSVTILGDVKNHAIPWTQDLTVAKAILAAGYSARTDPTDIVIVRDGKGTKVDPQKLLAGEDVPLQAGDVVAIRH